MNRAKELRAMIEVIKDDGMDVTMNELQYRKRQLGMYLQALDDVEKRFIKEWKDFLKPESLEDTCVMKIIKELRG